MKERLDRSGKIKLIKTFKLSKTCLDFPVIKMIVMIMIDRSRPGYVKAREIL